MSEPTVGSQEPEFRILVAVCTYNEAENIHAMLEGLREYLPLADLLVVDDDSPDGTAMIAEKFIQSERATSTTIDGPLQDAPVQDALVQDPSPKLHLPQTQLIVRKGQRGLGGAIKRAIEFAIQGEYDLFVNLDGDVSHHPSQVPRLIATATDATSIQSLPDVVVGSRYLPGGEIIGWPWRRRMMSRLVNRFATLFLRLPVSDCSGSMRCYRVSALKRINASKLRSEGYALLEELLVALVRSGATLAEVPITFTDRERGKSKLTAREATRSAFQIMKLAFRSDLTKT